METDYEKELRERLDKVGVAEDEVKKVIDDMLLKYPDIWDISYAVCYERTDGQAPEGYCTGYGYIKDIVVLTGRTKCENCDEYYLKTREWSKFCSNACRQATHRADIARLAKDGLPIPLPDADPEDFPEGIRKLITPKEGVVLFPEN